MRKGLAVLFVFETSGEVEVFVVWPLVLQFAGLFIKGRRPLRVFKGVILQFHHGSAHLCAAGEGGDAQLQCL
ncbi:hypothetical protein D3C76_1693710 [compost metagenome]